MWRNWADIHLLHAQQVFKPITGDSHSDTEDADDDVECALVWPSVEWDAVGGRGTGIWGRGGRGLDREARESCKREGEKKEESLEYDRAFGKCIG